MQNPAPTTPPKPQTPTAPPAPVPAPISQPTTPHVPLLEAFIAEIKNMEGWAPGSASYSHNNPGNLRCSPGQMNTWNSLANGQLGGFCTFINEVTGMQALRNVTISCAKGESAVYNAGARRYALTSGADLNLYQYFEIRDPSGDNNQPDALAERFGRVLDVNPHQFQMKDLLV